MNFSSRFTKHLMGVCLVSSLALLTGCGTATESLFPEPSTPNTSDPSKDTNDTTNTGNTSDTNQPIVGTNLGTVKTTINSDPDFLDPHFSESADTETMMNNVFEGLLGVDAKGEFVPVLAKDYTVSEDNLVYTFTLKDNVVFHNDTPMTADDVIYSYNRLSGLNGEPALSSKFETVTAITKLDDLTVQFTLSTPTSSFLSGCTDAVIPENYTEQATKPIGTGPYLFESYAPGQSITLKSYPHYHNKTVDLPVETVEFLIMPDPSSALLALKAGDLDIAQIDSINAEIIRDQFNIISYPQNMVQLFALNHDVPPFDDVRVRQAINYAIDQDLIINGVVNGYGSKVYTHGSPVTPFWTNDFEGQDPYPYDVEKAKTLLAEAGYSEGFSTTVKVPSNYQTHVNTAQVIADMLSKVGITLNIELTEWGQWLEQVYTNRNYETTIVALTGQPDPHDTYIRYTTDYSKNFYNYSNPDYDALINAANLEGDITARAELYKEAQQLLTEDSAAVYIMDPHLILGSDTELSGFIPYPYQFFDASKLFYINN